MLQLVAKTSAIIVLCGLWSCARNPLLDHAPPKITQSDGALTGTGAPTAPALLDVATTEEREVAITPKSSAQEKALGEIIVSLGNPADIGFWLKTSLIINQSTGRVMHTASGKSVNVTLFPLEQQGSGSQISLSAMRALDLPLTSLSSVTVFQD